MIALIVLFILCVVFITLRWFSTDSHKRFWPDYIDFLKPSPLTPCTTDKDCLLNQKCFQSKCYETLSPQQKCDPKTGTWEKTPAGDKLRCVCLRPEFVTQKTAGFSCDVHVNCSGPYGKVSASNPFECDCQKHFAMDPSSGQCIRKTESDRDAETHCPPGYHLSTSPEARDLFHADYLAQFCRAARCLKIPCSSNVLNHNAPLYHGTPEFILRNSKKIWFCSCDPRFGLFGVRLKNVDRYLAGDDPNRYNACASIYKEEPEHAKPYSFDFYCYFYLKGKSKPISFLVFHSLPKDGLVEQFRGKSSIVVLEESFPYTYDQQILQTYWPVYYRPRTCSDIPRGILKPICYKDAGIRPLEIKNCSDTPKELFVEKLASFVNNVIKSHFVCRLHNYTAQNESPVVVNPFVVDFMDMPEFSHGYHLKIVQGNDDWFVKPAPTPAFIHLDLDEDASTRLLYEKWKYNKKKGVGRFSHINGLYL